MRLLTSALLLMLLVLAGHRVLAQKGLYLEAPQTFTGGLLLGLNLAQVDGDMYFGYNKPGLSTGGYVRINFTPQWSAGMELLYTQKGSRGDAIIESSYTGSYVAKCHIGLNYVEVPVTVRYKFAGFAAEVGVSYARLVKTNEWILVQPSVPIDQQQNRFNDNALDFVFGLSRKVRKHLLAELRFQYSMIAIRPTERVPPGYAYGSRGQFNNLFCARLAYEF